MLGGEEGHDGRGPDRYVLGAAEHAVNEAAHKRGVEPVLEEEEGAMELTHSVCTCIEFDF